MSARALDLDMTERIAADAGERWRPETASSSRGSWVADRIEPMPDWTSLRDAYGVAGRVRELLDQAKVDDRAVWDELWSRLCHQGTVYSASYAALPLLTEIAQRRPTVGYLEPLDLAAAILASVDGPEDPATVRARFASEASTLNQLARSGLRHAGDASEFIYTLEYVLATEESTVWATRLHALADQELELECPSCAEDLRLDFEVEPAETIAWSAGSAPIVVTPADPAELVNSEATAYALAIEHGRPTVAARLLELFGEFECPVCSHRTHASQLLG